MGQREVFQYRDYKTYIRDWILEHPNRGHGMKVRLARAAGCQTSYLSQVLKGAPHLSGEQIESIAREMGLNDKETRYLYFLLLLARAGTTDLKKLISSELKAIEDDRKKLANRILEKVEIDPEVQALYFSSWVYAAVHLVATGRSIKEIPALANELGLSKAEFHRVVQDLKKMGVLTESAGKLKAGVVRIHLPSDSPHIVQHHTNWRLRALGDIGKRSKDAFHYSSVVTISKEDAEAIHARLLIEIESVRSIVEKSPEEKAYCFNLDFFRL